jgi:cytochrome P450/alkanesulfonate monooxygenase SsuD/methylene tetrahydromethanopterin reductase-like flavin-dependent oxidoreductase (luciferase family)
VLRRQSYKMSYRRAQQMGSLFTDFDHCQLPLGSDGTPYEYWRWLRDQVVGTGAAVGWSEQHGGFWVVAGYDANRQVLHDPVSFSNAGITFPVFATGLDTVPMVAGMDRDDHRRYRRLVGGPFALKSIVAFEDELRAMTNHLIDGFIRTGEVDLVPAIASQVPARMIAIILGLPHDDGDSYNRWMEAMTRVFIRDPAAAVGDIEEMHAYMNKWIAERRANPGTDVLSSLVAGEDGERLTDREIIDFWEVLLIAGIDNTTKLITSMLWHLAREPELRARLSAEPQLVAPMVEECLRFYTPALVGRRVTQALTLAGAEMRVGQQVMLAAAVANRDPRVFAAPDEFVADRSPNPHFGLGVGVHRCLGTHLIRTETRIVAEEFLRRIPEFELAPGFRPSWQHGQTQGMTECRLVFPASADGGRAVGAAARRDERRGGRRGAGLRRRGGVVRWHLRPAHADARSGGGPEGDWALSSDLFEPQAKGSLMTRLGVSMPILNQPYAKFPELARLADEAGFDSVWDYEFYRNPLLIHGLCAQTTSRVALGVGLAAGVARTPFEMANTAADVDELSGGRTLLGVGTGGAGWAEFFNGLDIDRPVARIREYIAVLRMVWHHLGTGEPATFAGEFYRFAPPPLNPWGLRNLARPTIPIYVAAVRPKMLKLAGEIADGVLGFLNTPSFVDERIRPQLEAGARAAGRDPADVELMSYVICSCSEDRAVATRRARIQVGMYTAYPVCDPIIEHMGLQEDRDAVVQSLVSEGPASLERTTSDELLRHFCVHGTADECREQIGTFQDCLDHVVLHTPYVPPLRAEESEDAFRNMVAAFARDATSGGAAAPAGGATG